MSRSKSRKRLRDLNFAFATARTFWITLRPNIDQLRRATDDFDRMQLPSLIFIFTNLIFGCELYLKIALYLEGKEPPEHHDLWRIFNVLSHPNQQIIRDQFNARFAEAGQDGLRHTLAVQLRVSGLEYPSEADPQDDIDNFNRPSDLKQILKETGSSYQTWRYLFEAVQEDKFLTLTVHFSALDYLCAVLDNALETSLSKLASGAMPSN